MSVLELKGRLLDLVSQIEDEGLLMDIYEEMTDRLSTQADQSSDWWDELSPAEQDELRKSVEESEDDRQLISHNDARKILTKWRK